MSNHTDIEFADAFDPLDRAVTLIDEAFRHGGWYQPNHVVALGTEDGEVTFALKTLPPDGHPLEFLLGETAPVECTALGVIAFGWAAPTTITDYGIATQADIRPSLHPQRGRVRTIALVDRWGQERGMATVETGLVVDQAAEGTVVDTLRRCFGLPTKPPPAPTAELFARRWLATLLDAATGTRPLTWTDAASCHPAFADRPPTRDAVAELVERARELATAHSWEQLRESVAAGATVDPAMPADLARWMDEGMYARWMLAGLPPVADLLAALESTQPPPFIRTLRAALADLGLTT